MTNEIGQKIREAQEFHRYEAKCHHNQAADIGTAWDIDELLALGAINELDAAELRLAKATDSK